MLRLIDGLRRHPPALDTVTVEQHRQLHEALAARWRPDSDVRIEAGAVGGVPAEIVRAEGTSDERAVLYLHGGGFQAGSPANRRQFAGSLSRACGGRVVVVEYRLAPEHPFPTALEDVLAAYQGLLGEGQDPRLTAFGGDSMGGGTLAIAALVAARDRGQVLPGAAFALSPVLDLARLDGMEDLRAITARYLGRGTDPAHPFVSPAYADLRGLPPIHIEVGSEEPMLGDAGRLVARARDEGVRANLEVVDGAVHIFPVSAPETPEARAAIARVGRHLRACWTVAPGDDRDRSHDAR
jgi:acetyl esterase/lipase